MTTYLSQHCYWCRRDSMWDKTLCHGCKVKAELDIEADLKHQDDRLPRIGDILPEIMANIKARHEVTHGRQATAEILV